MQAWQKASGYTKWSLAGAAMSRFKRVIGDGLRARTDRRRATEVNIAVHALNRMLEPGRPIPRPRRLTHERGWGNCARSPGPCKTAARSSTNQIQATALSMHQCRSKPRQP